MADTTKQVLGYNILFEIKTGTGTSETKVTIAGTTQDDFEVSAKTKDSIYKSLKGVTETVVTGHEFSFSAQGLMIYSQSGTEHKYMDYLLAQALETGDAAKIDFVYTRGTETGCKGKAYKGQCVITSYKESSGSEDTATWSATFKVTGALTAVS